MENCNNQLKMYLNVLVAFLAGILVINHANCAQNIDAPVSGLPIRTLFTETDTPVDRTTCRDDKLFDCLNCTARAACDSGQAILSVIACGKDAPFCDDGMCTSDPPVSECPKPVSPLCPTVGTFPSITSCTRYVKCTADRKATEYQCPANLVYDPLTKFCKRRVSFTDCPIINCVFSRNKFIVYPADKQIYFFCGASNNDIRVLKCPNGLEFNPTAIICEKKCTEVGYIEAADKSKYYLCVQNGDKFDKYVQQCPAGTKFDANDKECLVPNSNFASLTD